MAVSGDIIEVTCNHPELGAFVFSPVSGETGTYNLGGFQSADDDSMVTTNGQMIDQMTNKRWSFEVAVMWDRNNNQELENAQALQSHPLPGDWTITDIGGVVYGGTGKPVGALSGDGSIGRFPLKLAGGGKLKII